MCLICTSITVFSTLYCCLFSYPFFSLKARDGCQYQTHGYLSIDWLLKKLHWIDSNHRHIWSIFFSLTSVFGSIPGQGVDRIILFSKSRPLIINAKKTKCLAFEKKKVAIIVEIKKHLGILLVLKY